MAAKKGTFPKRHCKVAKYIIKAIFLRTLRIIMRKKENYETFDDVHKTKSIGISGSSNHAVLILT